MLLFLSIVYNSYIYYILYDDIICVYNNIAILHICSMNKSSIFHQKQVGNYCRCHALNNVFRFTVCDLKTFSLYCDEFDLKHNFTKGSSKNHFMFYNYGNIDNIFRYVIQKQANSICKTIGKNIDNLYMKHYDFYKNKTVPNIHEYKNNSNYIGCIVYNVRHTYSIRKIGNEFYRIDSMKQTPQKINSFNVLGSKGIGYIEVYI